MTKDRKYDEICKKLGFISCELNEDIPPIEDDNHNPLFQCCWQKKFGIYTIMAI